MTNTLAIVILTVIVGFFLLDHYVFHFDAGIVVMRGLIQVIEKMAFWR